MDRPEPLVASSVCAYLCHLLICLELLGMLDRKARKRGRFDVGVGGIEGVRWSCVNVKVNC